MNSNEGWLDKRVLDALGEQAYAAYASAQQYHQWMWKYHRVSDPNTLRFARAILYGSAALTLCPQPAWTINRNRAAYAANLGLKIDVDGGVNIEFTKPRWSGQSDPATPITMGDWGPGNCTAMYEMSRPGLMMVGYANALLFSIDGTLRNSLQYDIRFDNKHVWSSYDTPAFVKLIKLLEIASVREFAGKTNSDQTTVSISRVFQAIPSPTRESSINTSQIDNIYAAMKGALAAAADAPKGTMEAIAFGFLIDEIVARIFVPNGVSFSYREAAASLSTLLGRWITVAPHIKRSAKHKVRIRRTLEAHLETWTNSIETEAEVPSAADAILSAQHAGDELRTAAFAARELDSIEPADSDAMFTAANELWRWVFFLEQRGRLRPKLESGAEITDDERVQIVGRWLRRPWSVVRLWEIDITFRGFVEDDDEELPKLVSLAFPFFRDEPEQYLRNVFAAADLPLGVDALETFIRRRFLLRDLRQRVATVQMDNINLYDRHAAALLIIDLFTIWLYIRKEYLPEVEKRLEVVGELLNTGCWLIDDMALVRNEIALTHRQERIVSQYLDNPGEFVQIHYRLEDGILPVPGDIDVFPPEHFMFGQF